MFVMSSGQVIPAWFVTEDAVLRLDVAWPVRWSDIRSLTNEKGPGILYYRQHGSWMRSRTSGVNGSSTKQVADDHVPKEVQLLHLLEN